jgi:hypothetical protein
MGCLRAEIGGLYRVVMITRELREALLKAPKNTLSLL